MAGGSAGPWFGSTTRRSNALLALAAILFSLHWFSLDSTAYCQSGRTASGLETYVGEVANNMWPLGTRLRVWPAVFGLTRFRVEDRIGWGSQLDFFAPSCSAAILFGRRMERVRVIGRS